MRVKHGGNGQMTNFVKWNSLNQFHEVMKAINYRKYSGWLQAHDNKIEYWGKIKLHGTNASVTICADGSVRAAKRSSYLPDGGVGGDNAGFAGWVKKNEEGFRALEIQQLWKNVEAVTIYGEWCGPGVQANVACSATKKKFFYIFSADVRFNDGRTQRLYDPKSIEFELSGLDAIDDVIILPWHCKINLDFSDAEKLKTTLENLNKEVEAIGECDPFIKEIFEIEGPGEGLVFYPVLDKDGWSYDTPEQLELFSVLNFKAKSEAHRVNKTKVAAQADPEVVATQRNFADMFCTEARFEQAFDEAVGRQKDMKLTGDFIKWVCQDVYKESETERELLPVDWKKLSGAIAGRASAWYRGKCSEIEG